MKGGMAIVYQGVASVQHGPTNYRAIKQTVGAVVQRGKIEDPFELVIGRVEWAYSTIYLAQHIGYSSRMCV